MNIQLLSVHHTLHGAIERVVLEIVQDTNLANYLLTDSTVVSEEAPAEKHCFYFPILHARKGDRVHVVTGSGKNMILENEAGHKTYVFFYDQSECKWSEGVTPVLQLCKVSSTISSTPLKLPKGTFAVNA